MRYNFLSWVETAEGIRFLTDQEIFSSLGRKLFTGREIDYPLGHEAIRLYFGLKPEEGTNYLQSDFWQTESLPLPLAQAVNDFNRYFDKTFRQCFWFYNLYDLFDHPSVTPPWRKRAWQQILAKETGDYSFCSIIAIDRGRIIPDKWKKRAWQELLRRGVKNDYTLPYLLKNAPSPWSKKTKELVKKEK